uniref:protein-tyrosine sulfotransferase 1-like n=1 Tax=Styela clava TaxID=7725 RepID=UPI00193938A2|nr:protein-tyrosine sulfotransferase 1-like [Styela clava]
MKFLLYFLKLVRKNIFSRAVIILVGVVVFLLFILEFSKYSSSVKKARYTKKRPDEDLEQYLIFVGGIPRSGTTLMRKMLESHPDIRCGPETHVIPWLLKDHYEWTTSTKEFVRLVEAGVAPHALDNAMAKFILSIIVHHGPPAKYLCNKDPYSLQATTYLHGLFPNSKFILMLRDGRASAHSVISKGITVGNWNIKSYRDVLMHWNDEINNMYKECLTSGPKVCLPVHYEKLVLQPVATTKKIFNFLGIPWCKEVLHHEDHANETKLSAYELSTDQVKKPIYLEGLTKWFGKIPPDVERDMAFIAPMLKILGYNPEERRPKYGEPDDFVLKKLNI